MVATYNFGSVYLFACVNVFFINLFRNNSVCFRCHQRCTCSSKSVIYACSSFARVTLFSEYINMMDNYLLALLGSQNETIHVASVSSKNRR